MGRVANEIGRQVEYLEAAAKLSNADGDLLDTMWTNQRDIPADATWRFETSLAVYERADAVDDHTALVAGRPP